jgi:hypothetical protein
MNRVSRQKLWLLAAAVGLVLVVALWGANASIGYRSQLRCCIFDPGTGGGLGLTLWAQQLGIPVRALKDPLWEAVGRTDAPAGNCFLTAGDGSWSPWEEDLSREQWIPIQRWIARGNALVVMTTNPWALPKVFVDDVFESSPVVHRRSTDHSALASIDEEEPSFFRFPRIPRLRRSLFPESSRSLCAPTGRGGQRCLTAEKPPQTQRVSSGSARRLGRGRSMSCWTILPGRIRGSTAPEMRKLSPSF